MICTCTMNPSLDYYMEFEDFENDQKLRRSTLEYYEAGGKGINVSIVLSNLGIPSRAFGFIGGFTKDFYIRLLAKYEDIRPNFTYIDGATRINVKLRSDSVTVRDMHANGPMITHDAMENLMAKVSTLYEGDVFVLAGNIAEYLVEDTKKMIIEAIDHDIKVVLDTVPEVMKSMIEYHPFMYKTTPSELETIVGKPCRTKEEVIANAKALHAQGVSHVVVLLDDGTAVLICDEGVYESGILRQGPAVNTVGTGDSMVAGFLMNYVRTKDSVDSFRFGASCGTATAYSRGLATREKIDRMYESTEIVKIG
ncbi:MAG: 1-phosphofructokinase family hexose kinase [Bulleidia sp.]